MRNTGALSKKSKPRNSTALTTFLTAVLLLATTTSISAPAIDSETYITRKVRHTSAYLLFGGLPQDLDDSLMVLVPRHA